MTILVTGAAGKTGRAVISALSGRGGGVRALVRRDARAEAVRAAGAEEVVGGDMRDRAALRAAARGVRAIYHIAPNVSPHEVAMGRAAIDAARDNGVPRFVYHSVLHPQVEAMPHHWLKLRVEEMLFEAGLDFTILQPAAYMQNVLAGWEAITREGVYRVPYPVEARLSLVDLEDVAEVAARVLSEDGHGGAVYELAGPGAPTQVEVAASLSAALGRAVRAEQVSFDGWERDARAAGLGDYQVETLLAMFRYYARSGLIGNANVLAWLLGRPPTTFEDFARRAAVRGAA